jgi:hypothetical protein
MRWHFRGVPLTAAMLVAVSYPTLAQPTQMTQFGGQAYGGGTFRASPDGNGNFGSNYGSNLQNQSDLSALLQTWNKFNEYSIDPGVPDDNIPMLNRLGLLDRNKHCGPSSACGGEIAGPIVPRPRNPTSQGFLGTGSSKGTSCSLGSPRYPRCLNKPRHR